MKMYVLIGIIKAQCKAYAITNKFEWWDCILALIE